MPNPRLSLTDEQREQIMAVAIENITLLAPEFPRYVELVFKANRLSKVLADKWKESRNMSNVAFVAELDNCLKIMHDYYLVCQELRTPKMVYMRQQCIDEASVPQESGSSSLLTQARIMFFQSKEALWMTDFNDSYKPEGFSGIYFDEFVHATVGEFFNCGYQKEFEEAALKLGEDFYKEMVSAYHGMIYQEFKKLEKELEKLNALIAAVPSDLDLESLIISLESCCYENQVGKQDARLLSMVELLKERGVLNDSFDDYKWLSNLNGASAQTQEFFYQTATERLEKFSIADLSSFAINGVFPEWLQSIVEEKQQLELESESKSTDTTLFGLMQLDVVTTSLAAPKNNGGSSIQKDLASANAADPTVEGSSEDLSPQEDSASLPKMEMR